MTTGISGVEYPDNLVTLMRSNLGAVQDYTQGLMYQWGRKDPFLESTICTITWPSAVDSDMSTGTIEYATSHPTTIINNGVLNGDWYFTWDENTENARWTTSDSEKSIYDPCPYGWRVPDSDIWLQFDIDDVILGRNWTYIDLKLSNGKTDTYESTWLNIDDVAYLGYFGGSYWSASHSISNTKADILSFSVCASEQSSYVYYFGLTSTSHQKLCHIRCCKE
jgi:hypothetical protein